MPSGMFWPIERSYVSPGLMKNVFWAHLGVKCTKIPFGCVSGVWTRINSMGRCSARVIFVFFRRFRNKFTNFFCAWSYRSFRERKVHWSRAKVGLELAPWPCPCWGASPCWPTSFCSLNRNWHHECSSVLEELRWDIRRILRRNCIRWAFERSFVNQHKPSLACARVSCKTFQLNSKNKNNCYIIRKWSLLRWSSGAGLDSSKRNVMLISMLYGLRKVSLKPS